VFDVFICHSRADRQEAATLASRLERAEANVWLEECGAGTRETIASAWEAGAASAAVILLLSPEAVPRGRSRESWAALLAHLEANAEPPIAAVVMRPCDYPRLLERRNFHRWAENPVEVLRALERWALRVRPPDEGFQPARLPWFEGRETEVRELWTQLVDEAGTVALINPTPGSGKTSLAHEFARGAAGHFRAVLHVDCAERTEGSLAGELAARLGISLSGSTEDVLHRVDTAAREHRLLLFFDDVTGALPVRADDGGRASVLITARTEDQVPLREFQALRIDTWHAAEPRPPGRAEDLRLWQSMQACRGNGFPLELAARMAELSGSTAGEACARLLEGRCVDPGDGAGRWFRLSAQAMAAARADRSEVEARRRRHAEVLAGIYANWRQTPALCGDLLAEAEVAFRRTAAADWFVAKRIAESAASFLKAETRSFEAAEWYRQLLGAALAARDEQAADNCSWELSWLESSEGALRAPSSAAAQLSLQF
jgi:hypothetical protein